ncbi:Pls/PosA family non-ribosomal peptide synthetase [Kocuria sp. NPDC057446]|uniref:Pls/PosA family non-ribosomal peptide synthetase n=1 Tax=Kocuria sp. NPDC057446 TaxID=3346137 RepID=UPI003690CEE7
MMQTHMHIESHGSKSPQPAGNAVLADLSPVLVRHDVDNTVRWRPGQRLEHYFEQRCDELPFDHPAVITEGEILTFRELDARANQTARHFLELGLRAGDRIGVLFDKSVHGYVALLALLKIGATYVPLDPSFPADRIAYIIDDAEIEAIISVSVFESKLADFAVLCVYQDRIARQVETRPAHRLEVHEKPSLEGDELFYIIYTSGTTGRPKGVAIEHAGICNFVKVAGEVYGYRPEDRCYQGMSLAFDFHVEDLWTPLVAGSTLVAGKSGGGLFGADLHAYLSQQRVTVLPCVPTLWATLEDDLPEVRIIQLSGEAVPHHLVARWHRPGRQILNAYGPTECSVSSTLRVLEPDRPVTIGVPLPTYTVVILDEHRPVEALAGAVGEIGIAGPCLARGYLNREELTEQKFIQDFLALPNNPSGRIYRTGDYGRITADGELEFHGRIDTQVKLRGYRIELGEIESVLTQHPSVSHAVVNPFEIAPGAIELVGYYIRKQGAAEPAPAEMAENLRRQLPPYMVPSYLEELAFIPMTSNHKVDRKALPAPRRPRLAVSTGTHIPPRTETERVLAETLREVMGIERVSVTDDFFKDLGAHSLLMARFGGQIRKRLDLSSVSMREIYLHPTIEDLALRLESLVGDARFAAEDRSNREDFYCPPRSSYWLCGTLQASVIVGTALLALWLFVTGIVWAYEAMPSLLETYLRVVVYSLAIFALSSAIPIVLKWTLIGRWQAESIPIWSMRYFRFWLVKTSTRIAPMALVGGPIRNVYLRLLGAKIGVDTVILSRMIPVTTDLISIGAHTIVERDTVIQGYKARSNRIHIGTIHIGSNAFVGEAGVVDINTVMGDGSQLAFASSLHEGQRIPQGKHFHGSPAVETDADYCAIDARRCGALRRWTYALGFLFVGFAAGAVPLVVIMVGAPELWRRIVQWENEMLAHDVQLLSHVVSATVFSLTLFVVFTVFRMLSIGIIPRILNLFLHEGRTYVLYGFHYFVQQMISRTSNSVFNNRLFGDSSAIVHYLRWVGYQLNEVVQTGSNFGITQKHENPFMVDVGSGTMVSGGIKFVNETMSSDAFKLGTVRVGKQNYLGNYLHLPSNSVVGENCLIGTKALTPIDGPVRENTGLLGSPAFEIPRATERDLRMSRIDECSRLRLLRAKNRYNLGSAVLYLLNAWVAGTILTIGVISGVAAYMSAGFFAVYVVSWATFLSTILWMWVVERGVLRFGQLQPKIVPLLDPYFWFHERVWKLTTLWFIAPLFAGTPIKNFFSRMEGIHLGRMVFDDGAYFDEYTLITIGDYTNLNSHTVIQPHSLEEGVFKSGRVKIGMGCTLDCAANLHYDVTMEDLAVIGQNSFVMKGEMVESESTWIGNPAQSAVGTPSVATARGGVRSHARAPQ